MYRMGEVRRRRRVYAGWGRLARPTCPPAGLDGVDAIATLEGTTPSGSPQVGAGGSSSLPVGRAVSAVHGAFETE